MNPFLSQHGCRQRQHLLVQWLRQHKVDAALLTQAPHVHYFTGYWTAFVYPVALLITGEGEVALSCAALPEEHLGMEVTADQVQCYQSNRLGTLVDNLADASLEPLKSRLSPLNFVSDAWSPGQPPQQDSPLPKLSEQLLVWRRSKFQDEVDMMQHAVRATEAAYAVAKQALHPGLRELDLYGALLQAATLAAGEPVGPLGNNFQANASGASPRPREMRSGELLALDLSVSYRGYRSDLCRTFCVGGEPTPPQAAAHARVLETLDWFESAAGPGVSCKKLFQEAYLRLHGWRGYVFPHHLGHGIGLNSHEAPRLNPHWEDVLLPGDVVAVEPGVYHDDELKNGTRVEDNYLVTETGMRRLSHFSRNLT